MPGPSMSDMVDRYGLWACAAGFAAWSRAMGRPHMATSQTALATVADVMNHGPRAITLCRAIETRARTRR